jgi:hypothetical protein
MLLPEFSHQGLFRKCLFMKDWKLLFCLIGPLRYQVGFQSKKPRSIQKPTLIIHPQTVFSIIIPF